MPIHLRYFENSSGHIALPPNAECPCLPGYIDKDANTLAEIDRVQIKLNSQVADEMEFEAQKHFAAFADRTSQIRSDLTTRMHSAATSDYERDFIRGYLALSDQRKRDIYKSRYTCDQAYFHAREFNNPADAVDRQLDIAERS